MMSYVPQAMAPQFFMDDPQQPATWQAAQHGMMSYVPQAMAPQFFMDDPQQPATWQAAQHGMMSYVPQAMAPQFFMDDPQQPATWQAAQHGMMSYVPQAMAPQFFMDDPQQPATWQAVEATTNQSGAPAQEEGTGEFATKRAKTYITTPEAQMGAGYLTASKAIKLLKEKGVKVNQTKLGFVWFTDEQKAEAEQADQQLTEKLNGLSDTKHENTTRQNKIRVFNLPRLAQKLQEQGYAFAKPDIVNRCIYVNEQAYKAAKEKHKKNQKKYYHKAKATPSVQTTSTTARSNQHVDTDVNHSNDNVEVQEHMSPTTTTPGDSSNYQDKDSRAAAHALLALYSSQEGAEHNSTGHTADSMPSSTLRSSSLEQTHRRKQDPTSQSRTH